MTRTRSEYRIAPTPNSLSPSLLGTSHPIDSHRDVLAVSLLNAYRGTIDDEGEDLDDAVVAIDRYLADIVRPYSFVVVEHEVVIAFSFVLVVNDLHYIDPVVVAPTPKREGLGSAVVRLCLESLGDAGVHEVGATITDGNVASERLFVGLGFSRIGAWT